MLCGSETRSEGGYARERFSLFRLAANKSTCRFSGARAIQRSNATPLIGGLLFRVGAHSDPVSVGINWTITNVGANQAEVTLLSAYTGETITRLLRPKRRWERVVAEPVSWLVDLIVTVAVDPTFK